MKWNQTVKMVFKNLCPQSFYINTRDHGWILHYILQRSFLAPVSRLPVYGRMTMQVTLFPSWISDLFCSPVETRMQARSRITWQLIWSHLRCFIVSSDSRRKVTDDSEECHIHQFPFCFSTLEKMFISIQVICPQYRRKVFSFTQKSLLMCKW